MSDPCDISGNRIAIPTRWNRGKGQPLSNKKFAMKRERKKVPSVSCS